LRSAADELEKLDTIILGISFRPPSFNKDLCEKESIAFQLLSDEDRAVIKRYGVFNAQDNCAQRVSFLVDKEGVIRAIDREVKPATHGQDLVKLVKQWLAGKQRFQAACARCHGADGGDTASYPNIQTLKGIGNRHSESEILEMTASSGFVDLAGWGEEARHALAKYVKGL
jgi:alkyl hydroperoxide reductase subunit AhpC